MREREGREKGNRHSSKQFFPGKLSWGREGGEGGERKRQLAVQQTVFPVKREERREREEEERGRERWGERKTTGVQQTVFPVKRERREEGERKATGSPENSFSSEAVLELQCPVETARRNSHEKHSQTFSLRPLYTPGL